LIAALTLDIFNRHADKVAMANVAQLINNLHSLFLAREDKFVVTPNFHVFEMYTAHHHGQSLRAIFDVPNLGAAGTKGNSLPALAGSASLRENNLVLTVVNPHAADSRESEIRLRGAAIQTGAARVLAASDMHAHNTFDQPLAVAPRSLPVEVNGSAFTHAFPPASVTRLDLRLA